MNFKKAITLFLSSLFLLCAPLSLAAADAAASAVRSYTIPELKMTISLPLSYFVVSTSTEQAEMDASGLSDIDASTWISANLERNIYLEGVCFEGTEGGGLFALSNPETVPSGSFYVSCYPYQEVEAEHAFSGGSRLDWLEAYYTDSAAAQDMLYYGIRYTVTGRESFAGREWIRMSYSDGNYEGIQYCCANGDNEIVLAVFSEKGVPLSEQDKETMEIAVSSVSIETKKSVNYTWIIAAVSLLLCLGLMIFFAVSFGRKRSA